MVNENGTEETASLIDSNGKSTSSYTDKTEEQQYQLQLRKRRPSLSTCEEYVLSSLLIDDNDDESIYYSSIHQSPYLSLQNSKFTDPLSMDVLFSLICTNDGVPIWTDERTRLHALSLSRKKKVKILDFLDYFTTAGGMEKVTPKRRLTRPPPPDRPNVLHLGLWHAYQDGVGRKTFKRMSSLDIQKTTIEGVRLSMPNSRSSMRSSRLSTVSSTNISSTRNNPRGSIASSIFSDDEVYCSDSSIEEWSSDNSDDRRYNAWSVLKDEYAEDFGFTFRDGQNTLRDDDDLYDTERPQFRILGTSADDESAQPHVLSPPLMESLTSFLPEGLTQDNYWLKFSLIRDGASLATLRRYCRGAQHTVLAVETTDGDVFGAFTSSRWRDNGPRYYGSGEAFLWRMRYNRKTTPCHSIIQQAELETDIDVYPYSGLNTYVQLCMRDKIALGGGALHPAHGESSTYDLPPTAFDLEEGAFGFGLAITNDLLEGTSSPCATFRNGILCRSNAHSKFKVMNLEVWGFTPAETVDQAQKMELRQYIMQESLQSMSSSGRNKNKTWHKNELSQEEFYKRIGEGEEDEFGRDGMGVGIGTSTLVSAALAAG